MQEEEGRDEFWGGGGAGEEGNTVIQEKADKRVKALTERVFCEYLFVLHYCRF